MTELPTIAILFMTKEVLGREAVARKTIDSLNLNLSYEGPWVWRIACGKSSLEYKQKLNQAIGTVNGGTLHEIDGSAGLAWNTTIKNLFQYETIYLRMEDDFVLREKLDITPYVKLLMEREDIGMVRLGLMPINLDLHSTAHDGKIYFEAKKSTSYAYSGNPGLIHKRFHDAHGYFDETMNPGEIEVNFDNRIRIEEGPAIWMPAQLCKETFGVFSHIGEVKSYETK